MRSSPCPPVGQCQSPSASMLIRRMCGVRDVTVTTRAGSQKDMPRPYGSGVSKWRQMLSQDGHRAQPKRPAYAPGHDSSPVHTLAFSVMPRSGGCRWAVPADRLLIRVDRHRWIEHRFSDPDRSPPATPCDAASDDDDRTTRSDCRDLLGRHRSSEQYDGHRTTPTVFRTPETRTHHHEPQEPAAAEPSPFSLPYRSRAEHHSHPTKFA